jgi:hypothetical protein
MSEPSYDSYVRRLERLPECPEHEGQYENDCDFPHCHGCREVEGLTICPECEAPQCAKCWNYDDKCVDCGYVREGGK